MKKYLLKAFILFGLLGLSSAAFAAKPNLAYTNLTVTYGTAFSITPTNFGGGAPVTCTAAPALATGISIANTTGIITGTNTVAVGTYTYTITATNGSGTQNPKPTVTITVVAAPTLSYVSPAAYTVNTAITPLSPTSSGVATTGFGTGVQLTGATLSTPEGMAIDGSGNIYVTNYGNNTISKYNSAGTYQGAFGTGATLNRPAGIVFDASGNAYVVNRATTGAGTVFKYNSAGTYQSTIITGLSRAYGIAIDASGNLYIADENAGKIYKYANTGGAPLLTINDANAPWGVAVDGSGNIYAINNNTGTVSKYNSAGTFVSNLITGFNNPFAISIDPSGNIYVGDSGTGAVYEYNSSGTLLATENAATVTDPEGMVVDSKGDLYVSDETNNTVYKYPPAGGYYLSGTLPPGLSFNTNTGTVSGTPTTTFSSTTYTVTAYNAAGASVSATFTISCIVTPPSLSYSGTPYSYTTGISNTTVTISNAGGAVTSTYTLSITAGALPAGITFSTATGTFTVVPTAAGSFTGTVTASNSGGSSSAPISMTVTNPAPPSITYSSPAPTYVFTQNVALTGATDPTPTNTGGALPASNAYSYTGTLPTGLAFSTTTGIISGTPTVVTVATSITVTATNAGGTSSATFTITINPKAPVISYTPAAYTFYSGVGGTTSAATNTGGTATYTVDATTPFPAYLSINTATGVITASAAAVTTTATVYKIDATNVTGSSSANVTITVVGPPVLTYAATPYTYVQGTVATISITNTGGAPTSAYAETGVLPTGITFSTATGQFSIAATATVGTYTFTVNASNPAGSSSPAASISITINPKAPIVTYTTPNTWTVGTAYTLTPTSTGGAVASYAITSGSLPAGVTLNTSTGVISGTPTTVMATATIIVTATNVTGTSTPSIVITVNQVSPNITYVTPDVYTVGTVVSLPVTNPNSAVTTSYAITSGTLPTGLTLNTTSGLISGTASTVTAATTVTVTAYTGTSTGTTTVAITVNPLPPNISYTNPSPYVQGTTISNLVPSNSGGAVSTTGTYAPGVVVLKAANGLNNPYGMTADASGDVYVVNYSGNSVTEYSTTGTITTTSISAGGTGPVGLVFDSAGNAYVLYKTSNKIVEYAGGNFAGTGTTIVTGLNAPTGIVIDASNNLYIANSGANNILEYTSAGAAVQTITPPNNFFTEIANVSAGIAVDSAGNIYVADADLFDLFGGFFGTTVDVYSSTGTFTTFYEIGTTNSAISIDANGDIYLTDTGAGSVTVSTAAFASTLDTETGYTNPEGTVADGLGDYFVSDYTKNTVTEYSPVKGYYLTGTLPPGLYFNTTTGTISGRPQTTFALTTYTVTAYNVSGKSTTTFKISCVANPPVIAYTPPTDVYQLNLPISAPTLAVSGGPIMATGFAAGTNMPGTLSSPWGMTTDASGNIWVVNYNNATVIKYSAAGVVLNTFTVVVNPTGIAVDASGNFYVSRSVGDVYKYNAAGTLQSTSTTINNYKVLANGFAGGTADGIAIDASGNLYVSDNTDGIIWKIASGSTTATQFVYEPTGGILQPTGIQVDAAGNIFIVDLGAKALIEYSPLGAYEAKILTGLTTPYGIYVDANGDYFVGDSGAGTVKEYNEAGTLVCTIPAPTGNPRGLTVDASGNLYVSDFTAGTVKKYVPYYYSISPGLPAGLAFNTTTGAITGTPTTVFGPTVFTISVKGSDGNGSTTVTLTCASAPVFTYVNPPVYPVGTAIPTLSPTVTAGGPITSTSISPALPAGLSIDASGNITGTPTAASPTTVYTVTGTNSYGFSGTTTVTITCAYAPAFSYASPQLYPVGTAITALVPTITAGGPFTSTSVSPTLPAGLSIAANGTISGTPTAASPTTVYTVTATNASGLTGTATITITCAYTPVFTYTSPQTLIDGTAASVLPTITAGGPLTSATVTTNGPLPAGLSLNANGSITGTPTVVSGPITYTITGTNAAALSGTATVTITCDPALPNISYITPDVYNVGTTITALTPTNTGGAVVSWSISPGLPPGLSFDTTTGIISGTPTAISANTNYTVTATNVTGSATFVVTIEVNSATPIISYTTPDTYTVGSAIAPLVPTNTGSAATSWAISPALPTGLTFNTTTGTITGTPTVVSAAANYTVTATNGGGSSTFVINIACVSSGPVLTYTTPDVFPVGTAITPLSPVNTGSTPVNYAIAPALPAGLSFNTSTGVISGTPTATSAATIYTVIATDASSNIGTTTLSIACSNGNDWIGVTSTDWTDATNWSAGNVPAATDVANIGVNVTFTNFPNLLAGAGTINVGSVVIGTNGGQAGGVVVNTGSTLNVSGSITYQSDANAGLAYTATLSGAGNITAGGISVIANTALGTPAAYTETLASSITSLALSSNVALTSTVDGSGNALNATFNITGGITSVGGVIQTSNTGASTSTLSVTGATLQLAGTTALSGLSGTGTNVISFNNAGATIEYSGAAQTYYTDAAITGLAGGSITYNSIKFSGTGVKSANGTNANNLLIAGDFTNALTTNDATDYIDLSTPQVNFDGTSQNIYGGNGTGTTFYNVTISTTGTATIQSGAVAVASTGVLTMSGTSATLAAGSSLLTLNSDINGTATVAAIPTGCSITGTVNAQRFITGGALNYRGYRLSSSPVYGSNDGTGNIYSINYLINSVYLKGTTGTAGGFDAAGNPNIFLFRENLAGTNATFTSGNFRGVNTLGTAPNYSYLIDVDGGPYNIPVGAGYMFFFRGDRSQASLATESNTTYIPTNTTLTATGTLNQGSITARDWYTATSLNLGYTTISGMPSVEGYNLVGNPYPSSIDWDQFQTGTSGSGIYGPSVNPFIYIIDPVSNNYNVYQAGNGGAGTILPSMSNVIPSGQGFFVTAANASAQLVFNESAKTNAQANATNGNLLMARRVAALVPVTSQYLHLKLLKDSINTDGIIINFKSSSSPAYSPAEDARYKNGNGSVSLSSMSSDNISLAINSMPLPEVANKQTIIPLTVNATTDGTYQVQMETIKSIPALFTIFLKDAYRSDSLDMRANTTYIFDILHSDTNSYGAHRFSLVMGENPALMIHLLSFGASKIQTGDQVVWTTENEQNYTNFTVERSTDNGATFNDLGGFQSTGQGAYSYLDKTPVQGANQYRLKIVDINGTVTYSNVVTIMYANTGNQIAINGMMVYPNPTAATVNVSITTNKGTASTPAYSIEIVNNLGSVIKSAQSSSPLWQSDVSSLTPGTYFIRVIDTSNNTVVGRCAFVKL